MADMTSNEQALRSDNGSSLLEPQARISAEGTNEQHYAIAAPGSPHRTSSSSQSGTRSVEDNATAPPLPPRPSARQILPMNHARQPIVPTNQALGFRRMTAKEMALQPHTHELRLLPPYNKNHSRIKLWMAMLLFAWGAAITTISAIILAEFLKIPNRPPLIDWICYFGIPFGALDMVWNAAEVLTHCARGGDSVYPRGIHPGAHVGVHLIMWMSSAIGIGFAAVSMDIFNSAEAICNRPAPDLWWGYEYAYTSCDYYKIETIFWDGTVEYITALLAACSVTFIVHFALFVWSCVDTHHRNRLSLGDLLANPTHAGKFDEMAILQHGAQMPLVTHRDVAYQEPAVESPMIEGKVLQQPGNRMVHHGASATTSEPTPSAANAPAAGVDMTSRD